MSLPLLAISKPFTVLAVIAEKLGASVPIPTLPSDKIRIFSVAEAEPSGVVKKSKLLGMSLAAAVASMEAKIVAIVWKVLPENP